MKGRQLAEKAQIWGRGGGVGRRGGVSSKSLRHFKSKKVLFFVRARGVGGGGGGYVNVLQR